MVARYAPSRRYGWFSLAALCGALLSAWMGLRWPMVWMTAALFAISALAIWALARLPAIEIHGTHLMVGPRVIAWSEIRRLDQTRWNAPLVVQMTLDRGRRLLVVYPGDLDSSASLLRHLRRYSREALIDGIPYRQFWGEPQGKPPAAEPNQLPPPRYPLMRPEDEEEVERMFQRLKSVGRLDPRGSDEK